MEILAPAGHYEAMVAAVQNGADGVYLGFGQQNARRSAKNFTKEEFLAAVSYCHLRGVKVYLTLNILLSDRELKEAMETLQVAADAGVDGVILQDWGVYALASTITPQLSLHASTQMSIHTLSGVKMLERLHGSCAVLARELSKEEITYICRNTPMKIEIFGHGALCMCYSGQCTMSALIGGRSGNRGACAQPCRLPYRLAPEGKSGSYGHPLSLKDAALAASMPEVIKTGAAILKLEGRMKRAEYVGVISDIYSRLNREQRRATPEEWETLRIAFSRDGFTDGYFKGNLGKQMFGTKSDTEQEARELFAAVKHRYENEENRNIPVTLSVTITEDSPSLLTLWDEDGNTVTVEGDVPEQARNKSLTEEEVLDRLSKTGGTVFAVKEAAAYVGEGLRLSAASLNKLRRDGLAALEQQRIAKRPDVTPYPPILSREEIFVTGRGKGQTESMQFTVSLASGKQLSEELLALKPAVLSFPVWELSHIDTPFPKGETIYSMELPRIWRDRDEPFLKELLQKGIDLGFTAVQIHNIGHLALVEELSLVKRGDFGLNIYNSPSIAFFQKLGLSSVTLSFELREEQMRDLRKPISTEAIVYGRLPMMVTENCIIKNHSGCRAENLHGTCAAHYCLTDRKGETFPVLPTFGCRNEMVNSKVLFLADQLEQFQGGVTYGRLRFTTETATECVTVFQRYLGQNTYCPTDYTRGMTKRNNQ